MSAERNAPAAGSAAPEPWGRALAGVALVALLWTALPALLQSVPHADNVEQLTWAHALQWGYVKHPPLPTWLLHGAIVLFGPSALLTYALAMACVALTLLLLWRSARALLDARGAWIALLLSSANYYLMGRGSFLNHNTVMLPWVAASAWAVLRIVRGGAGPGVWVLLGLAQALGMLTKYQMAVVIAANALALLAAGAWRAPRFLLHAGLCTLATVLPLVPHLLWLQQHDYSSFAYAGTNLLADLAPLERVHHALGFVLQQLGRFAPALLAAGLAFGLARLRWAGGAAQDAAPGSARTAPLGPPPEAQRALAALALTPVLIVLLLGLLAGVAPQNHWGATTTLLLPLLAVVRLRALRTLPPRAMIAAVACVQVAAALWYAVVAMRSQEFHYTFPARALAASALDLWSRNARGTVQIVIGPDWEAGALALQMPSQPAVQPGGDRRQAPWITDARLSACGALVFWRPGVPPEEQIGSQWTQRLRDPTLLRARVGTAPAASIWAAVLPPEDGGC